MINFKKLERDALQSAQSTDASALATMRQALGQLSGVENNVKTFGQSYAAFISSAAASLVVQDANARAEQGPRARFNQPDAQPVPPVSPVSPAPDIRQLESIAAQVSTGRASLTASISALETAISARAARIAQLADNGGTP